MIFTRLVQGGNKNITGILSGRSYPAAATDAAATVAADTKRRHVLDKLYWSYSAAPTNGKIKVEAGAGNIIFQQAITAGGPGALAVTRYTTANQDLIVTLLSGAGAVVGYLDFDYHSEPVI